MPSVNERIARWADGFIEIEKGVGLPLYDREDRFWRGEDGLLAKIEERGLLPAFVDILLLMEGVPISAVDDGSRWVPIEYVARLLSVPPSQLAAALVEVIGDEQ